MTLADKLETARGLAEALFGGAVRLEPAPGCSPTVWAVSTGAIDYGLGATPDEAVDAALVALAGAVREKAQARSDEARRLMAALDVAAARGAT